MIAKLERELRIILREVDLSTMAFDIYWLLGFTLIGLIIASMRFKKNLD